MFERYSCHEGKYCSDAATGTLMADYSHVGNEDLQACEGVCTADPHCTCFIHTNRPDPSGGFAACKTVNKTVTSVQATARGYSAWVKT